MSTRDDDAALAERLKAHHAVMVDRLDHLSRDLAEAAAAGDDSAAASTALQEWIADVLVPHAEEEETTTYRAAGELESGRLLIRAMLDEHVLIRGIAGEIAAASDPRAAGAYARALFAAFNSHQHKENEIILPLLVDSPDVSLVEAMGGGHASGGHGHSHSHSHSHSHEP
ncbi:MAG: hemerythrin domain-containing protein [Gordonia sp. (in: high G+C Gram-positive bacteria)]|uniref:hemerythrin domain-containing protein n=1 Tax=Gordonia TaxID=2053 RepID=UPI003267C07A